MDGLILTIDVPELSSIAVQTRRGNDVENHQGVSISRNDLAAVESLKRRYPSAKVRSSPSPVYNCHGLTLASRRTRIPESGEIPRILTEDNYIEVGAEDVLAGDIVTYVRDGDPRHSGIVVELRKLGSSSIPIVVSKWGPGFEAVHPLRECPYTRDTAIMYYRIEE